MNHGGVSEAGEAPLPEARLTLICRFSSAILSISACCLLHFSSSFFSSPSSGEAEAEAEADAAAAEASAFVELMAEECSAAALVASASFCRRGGDCCHRQDPHSTV